MHPVPVERRARRSSEQPMALHYQLESTRERGRMAAVALSDGAGVLVAWAGETELCAEIGAVAPLLARGAPTRLSERASVGDDLSVRSIDCFGQALFLVSLGGGVARDALLAHSARGVQRILTAN